MSLLHTLGTNHGTDKVDNNHTFNHKSYLDIYETHFSDIRLDVTSILEIGVKHGKSLKVWLEYFPNATVYGIDINPNCKRLESDRVKIFIGSQDDEAFLSHLTTICPSFDIIIDDGSHINELTLKSFNYLRHFVTSGGIYIIEDTLCTYLNLHDYLGRWSGELVANKNNGKNLDNNREDMDSFITNCSHEIDRNLTLPTESSSRKIEYIHIHPGLIILKLV